MICVRSVNICDARKHILHIFPSFGIGGVPLRMARVINHFGKQLCHTIVALDGNFDAAATFTADVKVGLFTVSQQNRWMPSAVFENVRALRRIKPGLLLTYNWGAIEWAMAARLTGIKRHIHLEAGFGKEESEGQIRRRVLFRRWALASCHKLVVPSQTLHRLARDVWGISADRVICVPNGVDLDRFADLTRNDLPGFPTNRDELVIGTVAPLRPEKNLGRLLRAFATLGTSIPVRLVIAGEGVEGPKLQALAAELGIANRVVFTGQVSPEAVLGGFDMFALSSDTEQMPNALLEAMAASRAIVAVDVGDVRGVVSELNQEFIVARDDLSAFSAAMRRLLENPSKRATLGLENRERAVAEFSQQKMFTAFADILGL